MLPGVVSMSVCSLVTTQDADGTELTAENHAVWCQVHAGSIWAICAEGNPYPFAVGQLQMDPEELQSMVRKPKLARKGKLIKVWHVFGDELWKMGTQSAPNDGFSPEAISPVNHPHDQQLKDNQRDVQVKPSDAAHLDVKEPIKTSDKNLIDQWLNESLFQAIKVGAIKQKQLPILTNVFFASILLPCRRAGHVLDIKRSSYKQVSVFLRYMAAELVIEVEEKNGIQSVTSIDRRHPRVVSHEIYLMDSEAEQHASAHSHDQIQKSPIIEELYRLSPNLWRLIGPEEQQKDTKTRVYFTATEIRDLLWKYTQGAGLEDARNKACVRLDGNLTDILYPRKLASIEKYPLKLPRKDIIALLFAPNSKFCIKHHRIKLPSGSEKIIRGEATKIEICAKKVKNSIATTVANLEIYQVDTAECAKEVRRMWGCNATLTINPAHAHRTEVMISGQMAKEFVTYLETKHNIPSKFCSVSYGQGVRLKK
uniref:Ligatin putative n=1 Tax=Albugo laibachii Nc14 TaxID=890382 RepID=F0W0G0_9STRA|nr:ligatin putative [Albugo laibachii Nc14]|eukprot:CCA14532.1 ligatin putative [Albugo laibachii Nc14]